MKRKQTLKALMLVLIAAFLLVPAGNLWALSHVDIFASGSAGDLDVGITVDWYDASTLPTELSAIDMTLGHYAYVYSIESRGSADLSYVQVADIAWNATGIIPGYFYDWNGVTGPLTAGTTTFATPIIAEDAPNDIIELFYFPALDEEYSAMFYAISDKVPGSPDVAMFFKDTGATAMASIAGPNVTGLDYGQTNPIPEPGTLLLLGSGILGAAAIFRRKISG